MWFYFVLIQYYYKMNHYNTLNVKLSNSQLDLKSSIKVIKFLENRGILLKGTTRKITGQEEGFLNFLRPLMTDGLSSNS